MTYLLLIRGCDVTKELEENVRPPLLVFPFFFSLENALMQSAMHLGPSATYF
jgi:hypothetical protein